MQIRYCHTQVGTVMLATLLPGVLLCAGLASAIPTARAPLLVTSAALTVLSVLFSSLTVAISDTDLRWHFGPGLWRYRLALTEIETVAIIRNSWSSGFGIRRSPGFRLYNVSGLDAVEVVLKSGDRRRIGSDDVYGLRSALDSRI